MRPGRGGIAVRLLLGQLVVLVVAAATMLITVALIAPGLFQYHLEQAGETSPLVQQHAQEAFEITFGVATAVAGTVALATAGALFWLLARRVSQPVEELAQAAQSIAAGDFGAAMPSGGYGRELTALADAFHDMADRLAATEEVRTRLLSDLGHELRTPLATLEAYVDGIEDGIVPASADSYAAMRAQIDRLRRLAGDLKVAAAAQEHALALLVRAAPVAALLAAACEAAAPRYAAKGVQLDCAGGCPGVAVLADTDRIAQVLSNVLDNALRHTPAGGRVGMACSRAGDRVEITVTDSGEGIPADQLDAVFERFHRVDGARSSDAGGSGLGLTIARAIAEAHGGSLTAASPGPGLGTTLTLRLPVAAGRPAAR